MSGKMKSLVYSLLIVLILAALWVLTPMSAIPKSFMKLEGVAGPYAAIFFIGLFGFLIWLQSRIHNMAWAKLLIVSLFVGHLLSIIALTLAELLLPDGIERLSGSFSTAGVLNVLTVQLLFPFVLGGWFFAILGAVGLKAMSKSRLGAT